MPGLPVIGIGVRPWAEHRLGEPAGLWAANSGQAPRPLLHQACQHGPDVPQVLLLFGGPRQVDELLHSAS